MRKIHFNVQSATVLKKASQFGNYELICEHHFNSLNTVWTDILNSIAPVKCFKLKPKSEPWIDILKNCLSLYQRAVKKAKNSYFSNLKHHCTPKILFSVINSALNPPTNHFQNPSFALSEDFLRHFCDKVTNLRAQIQVTDYVELPPTNPAPPWTTFNPVSLQTVKEVITKLKPSFCPLDLIHPRFLRQNIDTVGPGLVSLLNKCLKSGSIPDNLKMAMVTQFNSNSIQDLFVTYPVLKKPSLDASVLENYRPISTLPFISKVMEKLQLQSFLNDNHIFEKFQSGFKSLHSTETALVRVLNDILMTTDSGAYAVLVMLDLSSAFDTVVHEIIISRSASHVGLGGGLNWFKSFLTNRRFVVKTKFSLDPRQPNLWSSSGFYLISVTLLSLSSSSGVYFQKTQHLLSLLCRWSSNLLAFD